MGRDVFICMKWLRTRGRLLEGRKDCGKGLYICHKLTEFIGFFLVGFCNKINIAREKEVVALHLYKVVVKVRKMILFVYGCVCVRRQKKP